MSFFQALFSILIVVTWKDFERWLPWKIKVDEEFDA